MNKKILILTILGLVITPLASHAFFFGVGTSSGVDQVIKKGQESGAISNQPGGGGDNPEPALAISNVSYQLKDAGDYYYIDVSFNTNKSVTKITVDWYDGWSFSKYKDTYGTVHSLFVKYVKPNTTTYFVLKASTATENVQSAQYSVAVPNATQKIYDVNMDMSWKRLYWSYFVASPPDTFSARYCRNGGSWNSWSVNRSGQNYWTDSGSFTWQSGDQLDIEIYNPSDRSETNIQDSIFYGNDCF